MKERKKNLKINPRLSWLASSWRRVISCTRIKKTRTTDEALSCIKLRIARPRERECAVPLANHQFFLYRHTCHCSMPLSIHRSNSSSLPSPSSHCLVSCLFVCSSPTPIIASSFLCPSGQYARIVGISPHYARPSPTGLSHPRTHTPLWRPVLPKNYYFALSDSWPACLPGFQPDHVAPPLTSRPPKTPPIHLFFFFALSFFFLLLLRLRPNEYSPFFSSLLLCCLLASTTCSRLLFRWPHFPLRVITHPREAARHIDR